MGAVVAFPGRPLVGVLVEPGRYSVMLAKIGAANAVRQTSYPTLAAAEQEAREGAALCGWRYIGVFDEDRLRRIAEFEHRPPDSHPHDEGGAR